MTDVIKIHFDGLCEPNPGTGAYGWRIRQRDKNLATGHGIAGQTNNEAEYTGLIEALKAAAELDLTDPILVMGDSQLVINQITGSWGCNAENLYPLLKQALRLADDLGDVKFKWIPREQNQAADKLSRKAYHEATGQYPPERRKRK